MELEIEPYLKRIGYEGPLTTNADTLNNLQTIHMMAVPFENLDITLGVPIMLDHEAIFEKVVRSERGGFCYELNGMLALLLKGLGYRVGHYAARVFGNGVFGHEFDHMCLRVDLDEPLLVDVGFGDSFIKPLRLVHDYQDQQRGITYRLEQSGELWTVHKRKPDEDWQIMYRFPDRIRAFHEFEPGCHYHQTSDDSSFTRKTVCSLLTKNGRVTYANGRLIETLDGRRIESDVEDLETCLTLLEQRFGVNLDRSLPLQKLLHPAGV